MDSCLPAPDSHAAWQLALSSTHTELLTIIQEAEGHKRELFSALEASVRTAEQLQVRTHSIERAWATTGGIR